jgi:hypothetical protein
MESSDDTIVVWCVCASDCLVTGMCHPVIATMATFGQSLFLLSSLNSCPLLLTIVLVEEILWEPRARKEHTSCEILE